MLVSSTFLSFAFEFFMLYLVQNNPTKTTKLAGASVLNNRHVFNDKGVARGGPGVPVTPLPL